MHVESVQSVAGGISEPLSDGNAEAEYPSKLGVFVKEENPRGVKAGNSGN